MSLGPRFAPLGRLLFTVILVACSDDVSTSGGGGSGTGGAPQPQGGAGGGSAGGAQGGAAQGGGAQGGAGACVSAGQSCSAPDDCCSHFCIDGVCLESGECEAAGTECTASGQCCSGRCEPETGTGLVKCLPFCMGEGTACEKALDCCDLNCNGGVCGGAQCRVEGEDCVANAECCSNICGADGRCEIDRTNPDCRPTGETCNSGTSNGCCEVCDEDQDPPICVHGAGTCHITGAGCTTDADCCNGQCLPNDNGVLTCQPPCLVTGESCSFSAECCGLDCAGDPPTCVPTDCVPTGDQCVNATDCCSGLCIGGHCDLPCKLEGVGCSGNADCCSGLCLNDVCAPIAQ